MRHNMVNTFGAWLTFVLGGFSLLLAFAAFFGLKEWSDFKKKKEEIENKLKQAQEKMATELEKTKATAAAELKNVKETTHEIENIKNNIAAIQTEIIRESANITNLPAQEALLDIDKERLKNYNRLTELKKAVGEEPTSTDYLLKGNALFDLKKYDEAIKSYDEAIRLKPDDPSAWYNKACAHSRKGDKKAVLANLAKAIALNIEYKKKAPQDEDFRSLWDDTGFQVLVK